jgi:diguanylate cyclase (GGDEF)-like protein
MSDTNDITIPTRVLLVGAEPSRALRADDRVELVRLHSAMEAVAELAAPGDREERSGPRVLALAEGSINEADAPRFVAAAREADPTAVLLLWRRDDSTPVNGLANGFDGVVSGPLTHGSLSARTPTATPAEPRRVESVDDDSSQNGLEDVDFGGESADFEALLTGADAREAFLETLRRKHSDPTMRLAEQDENIPRGNTSRVRVERRGSSFGVLSSARLDERALRDAAAWLSPRLALAEQMRQLREAALTDPLTGAHNRRYFDRYLPRVIEQARSKRLEAHLLLIDIDNFKQYNDKHGHPAGDDILVETVRMLKSVVRPGDKVCRIGGDEFAVVFFEPEGPREPTGTGGQSGETRLSLSKVAARIQRVVCEKRFPKLGKDAPGQLSVSGGLATFPWDAADAPSLIVKADQLAFQSKAAGKSVITLGSGSKVCLER